MLVLVLNCGSSSLKFHVAEVDVGHHGECDMPVRTLQRGVVTGIGGITSQTTLRFTSIIPTGEPVFESGPVVPDHAAAVRWVCERLATTPVEAVGHRIVHGGDRFQAPIRITAGVVAEIQALSELAPLHNPSGVAAIQAAQAVLGDLPTVAVFDTAFHQTLPLHATTYAIPQDLAARHRVRRYGFHGIAHASLAAGYAAHRGRSLDRARLVTLHLGHGCSATAIRHGCSVETSMGFTPLEGLVMGTRSGDVDPSLVGYLARREGVSTGEIERWLNEQSGLLGLSGLTSDMRELLRAAEQRQHPGAALAIAVFCHRVRKYLGAYLAVLGGADAVVFGGGIGEQAPTIRARICEGMDWCGLALDPSKNDRAVNLSPGEAACISRQDAGLAAYVVAADEETWIARETVRCLQGGKEVV